MTFASQVLVLSPDGSFVFRAHASRAAQMCHDGEAKRLDRRRIELERTTRYLPRADARKPNLRCYMGQAYTFREQIKSDSGDVVASVTQLKHIDTRDHRVFVLSVLDCLCPRDREQAEQALRAEADLSRRN